MNAQSNQLNLASLFQAVAGTLKTSKESLNEADTLNHDHGSNMVEVFDVISQAMQAKQNADPADQLLYASQSDPRGNIQIWQAKKGQCTVSMTGALTSLVFNA